MKILHIISQRPDSTGSGVYLRSIISRASTRGYQNGMLAGVQLAEPASSEIDVEHSSFVTFSDTSDDSDIKHKIVGMSDVMPYESRTFGSLTDTEVQLYCQSFSKNLQDIVARFSPDIIHSHHLWLLSSLTKQLFPEIPLVTTCHGTDLRQFINCPHLRDMVLKGCRNIDRVMALSELQKVEIAELYSISPERIDVVGGGFNSEMFHSSIKKSTDVVQILYAGKLSSFKGVPNLLRSLIPLKGKPFHLHLAGSSTGKELENCHNLSERLGEQVTVYGAIPQKHVAELMAKAHLFVFPSFFEGLPLVILEALASNCRVITTDLPGANEIIEKTGTQRIETIPMPPMQSIDTPCASGVENFDNTLQKKIAEQIRAIAGSPAETEKKQLGNIDYFSWEQVFQRVENAYKSVRR